MKQRFGGSFAPPITAENLDAYRLLADKEGGEVGSEMVKLCEMVEVFYQTPESKLAGTTHDSGRGTAVPLEDAEIKRIWDYVPWPRECDSLGVLFETIPADSKRDLRNAAFHLLWYARELTLDREPITTDKL